MEGLEELLEYNRRWAQRMAAQRPELLDVMGTGQTPKYLWIGCSDARVPPDTITGVEPGQLFVHRNVANQVLPDDANCMSVLQFAVDVLRVEHIVVCGHYGCGGIQAAIENEIQGPMDQWLIDIRDTIIKHEGELVRIEDRRERERRLCELNVFEQVRHVVETPIVQQAWTEGQQLAVHGWIFCVSRGLLRDLDVSIAGSK